MSDPTYIKELGKEIKSLCSNCDRPDKEQLGKIILSSMALGFNVGLETPSIDRPQGEWIYVTVEESMRTGRDYGHHCSECDELNENGESNFCPNCGARMI